MKEQFLLVAAICILLGVMAATLTAVMKLIFFIRQEYAYRSIFKAALTGEMVGLLVLLLVYLCYGQRISGLPTAGNIWSIPVCTMLTGLVIGAALNWRSNHSN
jgi:hypothetical protein